MEGELKQKSVVNSAVLWTAVVLHAVLSGPHSGQAAAFLPDVWMTAPYHFTYHLDVKYFQKRPFSDDWWRPASKWKVGQSESSRIPPELVSTVNTKTLLETKWTIYIDAFTGALNSPFYICPPKKLLVPIDTENNADINAAILSVMIDKILRTAITFLPPPVQRLLLLPPCYHITSIHWYALCTS